MASSPCKLGCVVMAAGNASRFGSNKLTADFHGQSLFSRALAAVPKDRFTKVVVVTQYDALLPEILAHGFLPIPNHQPELGQSHTLQLGLEALADCDGVLFQVSDQPLLRQESIRQLLDLWEQQPDSIAALACEGSRGNPCLFPARLFPELQQIQGDRGGSAVIRKHPQELLLLEVPQEELSDVDTLQELQALQ